ncbi:MAG: hypothetical protein ACE5OQ_01890 [Woeseia sp.]
MAGSGVGPRVASWFLCPPACRRCQDKCRKLKGGTKLDRRSIEEPA